jgi:hypothetical protein
MLKSKLSVLVAAGIAGLAATPALAIDDIFVSGDLHVNLGIEAGGRRFHRR